MPLPEPKEVFTPSDAWLLLALILAKKPADRGRIIEAGDMINRAIFTEEEFAGGLSRLRAAGYVAQVGSSYMPTQCVLDWYERVSPKRGSIRKDLERVEAFLGVEGEASGMK